VSDVWTPERVARWLRQSEGIERQLAPVSEVLFAAAALQPGERVLDVGCGAGPTTREAADAVGPSGRVTGLDVAAEMIDAARAASPAWLDWIVADAVTWEPPAATWDVVLSRFGVMFFSDPATAFANLARATAPGGRLAMATWSERTANELFEVPLHAALTVVDRQPPGADEGPFSLHDADAIAALLGGAGWSDATTVTHDLELSFAGGVTPDEAARAAVDFGPTRVVLEDADDATRQAAVDAIAVAFADHVDGNGNVVLGGRVLVTTARR
jgi:SAM-dependent methyltransferase